MSNEVVVKEESDAMLIELKNSHRMCQMLMATPHYKKLGAEGIFAIVEKSRSMGVSPLEALNGGMYFVKGKVELTSAMMNQLIRQAGHSVTKDKRSDDTICILHGKRADNGDTWVESFSIEDAKLAGIYQNQWLKYPKDMLFARALSRLARQLYPDVIKGCYVLGEISDAKRAEKSQKEIEPEYLEKITNDEAEALDKLIGSDDEYRKNLMDLLYNQFKITEITDMPRKVYAMILPKAEMRAAQRNCGVEFEELADS